MNISTEGPMVHWKNNKFFLVNMLYYTIFEFLQKLRRDTSSGVEQTTNTATNNRM